MMSKKKVEIILEGISKGLFEKEEVIKLAFLSAIAGQSIFLIGPPGVAKSLIARRLKYAFKESVPFEYLMNRFSTPDEIFGPISIDELKAGKYKRITEGYLPEADVVFLDEIWKAGPSIQNTLLTVLNERIYKNGIQEQVVKMKVLVAASNELPAREQGLEALWDRFIIRYKVNPIIDELSFNEMITETESNTEIILKDENKIDNDEYQSFKAKIDKIEIPDEITNVIKFIRYSISEYNEKGGEIIYVSDRRWKKIIAILRASAFLNDRKKVDLMDCFIIRHCIWDNQMQNTVAEEIVAKSIKEFGYKPSLEFSTYDSSLEKYKNTVDSEIYESYEEDEEDEDGDAVLVTKKKLISKKLSVFNVKGFDENADKIHRKLDEELAKLETYLKKDLKEIRNNLFVPTILAEHVESNISGLKERIRQFKIEVDKIKASYEDLR